MGTRVPEIDELPPVIPVLTASAILRIGKSSTYAMIRAGEYPVRVILLNGKYRVSRADLADFLHAGQSAVRPA